MVLLYLPPFMPISSVSRLGALLVFVVGAVLEVGGDALIRRGMRGGGVLLGVAGFLVLGSYGVVVNLLNADFSRVLGAYVAVFAIASVLAGRFVFDERVPRTTWLGLAVILCGSLIVHFGRAS
jgi:drug/metabolite transporter superfamily protein YnfA